MAGLPEPSAVVTLLAPVFRRITGVCISVQGCDRAGTANPKIKIPILNSNQEQKKIVELMPVADLLP
ncbi:hypothetical protein EGI32_17355 [Ferruginibacter sp. HRS2-29]|nr:hypothetical protein [Ferruginibacter sp. HRS2-29]